MKCKFYHILYTYYTYDVPNWGVGEYRFINHRFPPLDWEYFVFILVRLKVDLKLETLDVDVEAGIHPWQDVSPLQAPMHTNSGISTYSKNP